MPPVRRVMVYALKEPARMRITDTDGKIYVGGSQDWYADRWQRASGCGPVAACNLIWYLTGRQGGTEEYKALMREMFTYVTPGLQGVNTAKIFTGGLLRYAEANGLDITTHVLEVAVSRCKRPGEAAVCSFAAEALQADAPIAFLNLSNGSLGNLENWHWVTILALDTETMDAEISDGGETCRVSLSVWLRTTLLGGVMVWAQRAGL
ncbi:MAG: hypothetical protein LBR76_00460 [Oscillospiraceae bacterium]|jgi:hypothetical protein|nr:hypothetical protein [Oscillospiraceae bacterium]